MKRMMAAVFVGVVVAAVGVAQAGPRAPESCSNAYTVFVTGDSASAEKDLQRIRGLLVGARGKYHFEVVDGEPDAVHKIAVGGHTVTGSENLRAIVGKCSHGGTCNQAAELIAEHQMGSPAVYCGKLPDGLE